MDSDHTRTDFAFHKTPVTTHSRKREAGHVSAKLVRHTPLSLADDPDIGCDPYNSTGQHVILQAKLPRKD